VKANKTYIAYTRITEEERIRLNVVVAALPGSQAAHIAQAVTEYCDRIIPTLRREEAADKQAVQA